SAVPLGSSSLSSGIKAVSQVTNAAGNNIIGGTNGKVAWFNDTVTNNSGQLEFNAGASGQSYLAASFELYNNATPSASGTMPLIVSFAAWNTTNTTAGGSSSNRIAALEFNQFGSLTTPAYSIKGATTNAYTYTLSNKQTVHLFANDHDTNSINYVGPDGNVRTLVTNSFAVFLNGNFIGTNGLYPLAIDKNNVLLTGNSNLGRLCFNTSSGNTGNWLIDNVVVSDMPTDVLIPAASVPLITSTNAVTAQAGYAFNYQTTTTELADSFTLDGTLPNGLTFNTASGLISGSGAPNQNGVYPVTIYANNSAGSGQLDLTLTFTPAPPNIFSGTDPSLNTATSWSLGAAPNASSSAGSYTDLVFSSSVTNLTTSSGNINGKSWNVTNGLNYVLSSVRDTNSTGGTVYKIGNTGPNDVPSFTNTVTGNAYEMVFLTNSSSLTLSATSPSNNIPATAQLRNSGMMRIETGSTLNIPCNIGQTAVSSAYGITKQGGGKLILSGSNSYTGATTVEQG
ncbi:hypothetical protein EBT23_06925, partial [bacterium]|nr:hypothetical protein [bacterium]